MIFIRLISSVLLAILATSFCWWLFSNQPIQRSITGYILLSQPFVHSCLPTGQCLTTPELLHLKDVQIRFQWIFLILPTLLTLQGAKSFKLGRKTLAVIGTSVIIVSLNFQNFFILAHYLVFPHGNWSFPSSSVLIQTYPLVFWGYAVLSVFIFSCIFLILNLTKPHISGSMKRIRYVVTRRRS